RGDLGEGGEGRMGDRGEDGTVGERWGDGKTGGGDEVTEKGAAERAGTGGNRGLLSTENGQQTFQ
ncbi:unnamed protein product, partial [Closterium sp. NIES-54]